jgi:hypothetical protein
MANGYCYLHDKLIFLQNVKTVTPETQSDSEAKLMSSVYGDSFIDVKQEEMSEPFSFVSVKVRTDEC